MHGRCVSSGLLEAAVALRLVLPHASCKLQGLHTGESAHSCTCG